jgi:hypothetical protein
VLTGGSGRRIGGILAGQERGHIKLIDEPAVDEQALCAAALDGKPIRQ